MENIVCTMPLKPKSENGLSIKIGPILTDFIGDGLGYKKALSINVLNTYKDKIKELDNCLNELHNDKIMYEFLYSDKELLDSILQKLSELIFNGIIVESEDVLLRCDCGKVETLKRAINSNSKGKVYEFRDGDIYCKHCNSKCIESKEKILKMDILKDRLTRFKITPVYLSNVVADVEREMTNSYVLVSKKRETGCEIAYNNTKYNIDIDFIWQLMLQMIPADRKILIAGNRQISKMFITNYLNGVMENRETYFIAHPFVYLTDDEINKCNFNIEDKLIQKIVALCNLKWRNNNCSFTSSIYKCLVNMTCYQRIELYNEMLNYFSVIDSSLPFEKFLEMVLIKSSNFQLNNKLVLQRKQ